MPKKGQAADVQGPSAENAPVQRGVLIPLAVAMLILLGAFALNAYWILQSETENHVRQQFAAVRRGFLEAQQADMQAMKAVIEFLQADGNLAAAMKAKDRRALLATAGPVLERLRRQIGTTHLCFADPDRVAILRVHQPECFGDVIDRFTMREAARTGEVAHGFEFGPLGVVALRVVAPWHDGSQVIGYLELGNEIDHFVRATHQGYDVEVYALIEKQRTSRQEWEAGMRMLNRPGQWNELNSWVVAAGSGRPFPRGIEAYLEKDRTSPDLDLTGVTVGGSAYFARCEALRDARGAEIGRLMILQDVTAQQDRARTHIALAGAVGVVAGGFLAAYFLVLVRSQRHLAATYQRLAQECRTREEVQRRHADETAKSHSHLQTVIDAIADPFMVIDRDCRVVMANRSVRETLGGIDPVARGLKCHQVSHHRTEPCGSPSDACPLEQVLRTKSAARVVHTHYAADGREYMVEIIASPVFDEKGEVVQVIESCRDITDRCRAEQELQKANRRLAQLATTDELTALWNRRWFIGTLEREVQRQRRHGTRLALVMLDLDHFKDVNDTHGHAFGDLVLTETARLLKAESRATDFVARYGGEEFVVLMPDTSLEEAVTAAERMRRRVAERPISAGERSVQLTLSAGVVAAEGTHTHAPDALMRLADEALYDAKRSGRNRTCASGRDRPAPAPLSAAD
jgi:diguanylate cyclase (GGDEF)-like protein/PAS domain S-box-containing protein